MLMMMMTMTIMTMMKMMLTMTMRMNAVIFSGSESVHVCYRFFIYVLPFIKKGVLESC
jgi:hypothetical protein